MHSFLGTSCTLSFDIISPKNGILVNLKCHLFSFKYSCQHICITHLGFCHGLCHQHCNLQSKCHLQYKNTFDISLNDSSIFCCNMSLAGATPNDSLVNLFLPNGLANVVRYDNFISNFRLRQCDPASIMVILYTFVSLESI